MVRSQVDHEVVAMDSGLWCSTIIGFLLGYITFPVISQRAVHSMPWPPLQKALLALPMMDQTRLNDVKNVFKYNEPASSRCEKYQTFLSLWRDGLYIHIPKVSVCMRYSTAVWLDRLNPETTQLWICPKGQNDYTHMHEHVQMRMRRHYIYLRHDNNRGRKKKHQNLSTTRSVAKWVQ